MPASTSLEMLFVASAMAADIASVTVPDPTPTEAVTATSVALTVPALDAPMVSGPPMVGRQTSQCRHRRCPRWSSRR